MADHKFTLEEILNEYSEDGKRSGIQRTKKGPISHGKLETEKLVIAATSKAPLARGRAGYREVRRSLPEDNEEKLVDIKSTISHIKAAKEATAAKESEIPELMRERFPTQQLRRGKVSFIHAAGAKQYSNTYVSQGENSYDGAVKLIEEESATEEKAVQSLHQPSIRQMQDSTRAREKQKKNRRRKTESSYAKESVTGQFSSAKEFCQQEKAPVSRRKWEEETDYYYQGKQETTSTHNLRQRVRSHAFGVDAQKRHPDNLGVIRRNLIGLRNVVFFRFAALLLLAIAGAVMAFNETMGNGTIMTLLTPRIYALVQLLMAILGIVIAFPTVKKGIWNLFRFHADSDSAAILPLIPSVIGAILAVLFPSMLQLETVHLFVPCALLALFFNVVGRLLVVRRALRNVNVIARDGQKRVLSYVSQEETAELLARGVVSDFPVVSSVRKAAGVCDIMRYTYSADMADSVCRTLVPIETGVSLLIALGMSFIRMGTDFGAEWFSFFVSLLAMLLTAGCCVASAMVVNLPLERESKKAARSDSAMMGYQSVDDFFDTNALLVEATDLFPQGSVQIQGLKVFSGAKVDEVLLDAASLVQHADSILQHAFAEMIPDQHAIRPVDDFVCKDGLGLCGWIQNRRVLFGSREMMANHNIEGLPTKTREAELVEGDGDVLYLSVSGVLSAMFSISITADEKVRQQMQALRQEKIALIIRSVDCSVTLMRLSSLFQFPEHLLKIVPTSMHHLFQRETSDVGCVSASMTVGGTGFGAASLLLGARRVRRAAQVGIILQVVSVLLGICLVMMHIVTGAYAEMTAQFFWIYHVVLTVLTAFAVRIR